MITTLDEVDAKIWSTVPATVDSWVEKTAAPAWDIKQTTSLIFTNSDVGFYWHPEREKSAMFARLSPTEQELTLCKMALDTAVGSNNVESDLLSMNDLAQGWVKVAYSPTVRKAGELLNFFPGKYPGGIPNAPSPLASTLTGGLVGAGLGYGAGYLGEKLLPKKWRQGKLKRTLAVLGGLAGAAPGAAWMYSASDRDRSMLDGSDLSGVPMDQPNLIDQKDIDKSIYGDALKEAEDAYQTELHPMYSKASASFVKKANANTMGNPYMRAPSAIEVNINKMGHTLWEVGASPRTAATTMGALYAAQQMPDPHSRPGRVSPHQTGLLGSMMGAAGGGMKGYAVGWLAGKALGLLTGMPAGTQNTLKNSGAIIGIVNSVVPRLFG
jgi:hypothetical protein